MKKSGGNLSLPQPKMSKHIGQKKDSMAKNVGGAAHMAAGNDMGKPVPMMKTGGAAKKPSKFKAKY